MSMTRENQVCAVIDSQGFFIHKKFYPRELSIVNNEYKLCFEIVPNISLDNRINYLGHFNKQTQELHGIPINRVIRSECKSVISILKFRQFIEEIYLRLRTDEKPLFAVKNQQMAVLLKEFEIPFLNLEKESVGGEICPTLSAFDSFGVSIYCPLHAKVMPKKNNQKHRCALRKSKAIWDWLTRKVNSDLLLDEIFPITESS